MTKNNSKKCNESSKSSDSSNSDSSSDESNSTLQVEIKHKHRRKNHKKDSCSSDSDKEKCKKKKNHKKDSCSSDSDKEKCDINDLYNFYKYKLLTDDNLMLAGSDAYMYVADNTTDIIPINAPVEFNKVGEKYNIEYKYAGAPFIVKESGIYIIFFVCTVQQSSQFTIFVNGVVVEYTTTGNNSGGGQSILRNMLKLKKNDSVLIRNHTSSTGAIITTKYDGGLQESNDSTFLIVKIAPCENDKHLCNDFNFECLSKKNKYLFKKVLDKLLLEQNLMLKGFNVHGVFFRTSSQTISQENDINFEYINNVNNLTWNFTSPEKIYINEDGIYKIFCLLTTSIASQFAITVNGIPDEITTQGTNKGAVQLTLRAILKLKKGDYLTLRNHTSANSIVLSQNAGGINDSLTAEMTVFKIAPSDKPTLPSYKNCYKDYDKFKCYLMSQESLQVNGSPSYLSVCSTHHQILKNNDQFNWDVENVKHNMTFDQGNSNLVIDKDGIYDIFADILTAEPLQITFFINGVPDLNTVSGRDSGGTRCLMRQFVKLLKGDIVDIRNYQSNSITVQTTTTTGGTNVTHTAVFMIFMLSSLEQCIPKKDKKNK
jgi:hypothetical protein